MSYGKISQLLENIISKRYSESELKNATILANTIAEDLDVTPDDAMSMLGYLLARKSVELKPGEGIVAIPTHPDVKMVNRFMRVMAEGH